MGGVRFFNPVGPVVNSEMHHCLLRSCAPRLSGRPYTGRRSRRRSTSWRNASCGREKNASRPSFRRSRNRAPSPPITSGRVQSPASIATVSSHCRRTGDSRRTGPGPAPPRLRRRSGNLGARLLVRDRRVREEAVSGYGSPWRRALPVFGLRAGDRRRRDRTAGAGRPDGRAALRSRLQAAGGDEDEVGRTRSGQVGARISRHDPKTTTERKSATGSPGSCRNGKPWTSCRASRSVSCPTTIAVTGCTACFDGRTCSRPDNSCATVPAWRCFGKCSTRTWRRAGLTTAARQPTGIWR